MVRASLALIQDQVVIDWMIVVLSVFLEVFGISLFLEWLIDTRRKRRLEPRRQIALRRILTAVGRDLFIQLARENSIDKRLTEEEDIRLSANGKVTPSTNLPLHNYILQLAGATSAASKAIENLIDIFGEIFEIEFVNNLFQLIENANLIIQSGEFIRYQVIPKEDETEKAKIVETVNESFDPLRLKLMQSCTEFIVKRIYPQSSTSIKNLIQFHLLNFYVGYYPEICDLVLEGKRMKIST
jgi:hypothetical protein